MTEPDPAPGTPNPRTPLRTWDERLRVSFLADWLARQRGSFTDAALERSAIATGYTHEEFVAAVEVADARRAERAALEPIRSNANKFVLGAYAAVWLLFAIPYLLSPNSSGPTLQLILTIALGTCLAISLAIVNLGRPNPKQVGRATVILLVVPVLLLLGVAGTCLPFVGTA
jgi:hypothetical protein